MKFCNIIFIVFFACQPVLAADTSVEQFDYFTNNWNVVGLKDYNYGARITPDNRLLLSGRLPIEIRVGRERTPLSRKHGKLAAEGWKPIILVEASDGPVRYDVAFWATPLTDAKDWKKAFDWPTEGENFLTWIRVRATNTSQEPVTACIEIAPQPPKNSKTKSAARRSHTWKWELPTGKTEERVARYTFFPVEDPATYDSASAALWLNRTKRYWQGVINRTAHISVPCRKSNEALLAAHVCQLIANDHGEVHAGEGFYDDFYIRDGAYQVMELEEAGFHDTAAKAIELYLRRQRDDGRFESQENQFDANGQAVWTLWHYYKITRDRKFLERAYPQMLRASLWTMQARRKAPADSPYAGVLPVAPADGENLWDGKQHIVGYDLWNLRGMLCTAEAARELGKKDEVSMLLAEADAYRKAIDAAWKRTGLAYFPPSWEKRGTHWGNTETLWPTELFDRDDARVAALIRHVRKEFAGGFTEGTIRRIGRNPKDLAIHPYMGSYTTMADLVRGRDEQVVEDYYWYLLHSTAAHAFPEGIFYKRRFAWHNTIPHVAGACNFSIMLRHMLVHESGDELHLLKAVPDWWLAEGQEIRIERLPTHFGLMNMTVRGTASGIELDLDRPTRNPPKRIILTVPKSRPPAAVPEGVEVVVRSGQRKRWDFPTVVNNYRATCENRTTEDETPSQLKAGSVE